LIIVTPFKLSNFIFRPVFRKELEDVKAKLTKTEDVLKTKEATLREHEQKIVTLQGVIGLVAILNLKYKLEPLKPQ